MSRAQRKRVVQLGLIDVAEPGEDVERKAEQSPIIPLKRLAPIEVVIRPGTSRPTSARVHGPMEYADTIEGRIARYPALASLIQYGERPTLPGHFVAPTLDLVEAQRRSRAFVEARTARGVDPGTYPCLCDGEKFSGSLGGPAIKLRFRRPGETCETCGYDGYNAILFSQIAVAPTKALWPGGILTGGIGSAVKGYVPPR